MKALALLVTSAFVVGEWNAQVPERLYVPSFSCSDDNLSGKPFDNPGVLVVHVMDWTGEPLPGAVVEVSRGKSLAAQLASDAAGRAVQRDLPPGSYSVRVTMTAFLRAESRPAEVRRGCTTALSVPLQVIDPSHSSVR